jgi:hypothetical protein
MFDAGAHASAIVRFLKLHTVREEMISELGLGAQTLRRNSDNPILSDVFRCCEPIQTARPERDERRGFGHRIAVALLRAIWRFPHRPPPGVDTLSQKKAPAVGWGF